MEILENYSLKALNTFGIDVNTRYYSEIRDESDILEIIRLGMLEKEEHLVLGGGSNILFTGDYNGLVLKNSLGGIEVKENRGGSVIVNAGAGVVWDDLVRYCIDRELGGIENLILIPGSVGAAPIQNIGAYGVEVKDRFFLLEAIELSSGSKRVFTREECRFGYRDSVFKREAKGKFLITSISLRLEKNATPNTSYGSIQEELRKMGKEKHPDIRSVGKAVETIRRAKLPDPDECGNAGSFFKNPVIPQEQFSELRRRYPETPSYPDSAGMVKVPAGWLIEQCGWKGKNLGQAGVHDRQALVLINKGNANGAEVLKLARSIRASVHDEFGIDMEMEVNIL